MSNMNDWNKQVIEEFRANGGKVGGRYEGGNLLLLHTVGAKSGQPRVHPLVYFKDGGKLVIVAAKGGAPSNPDWYYNILAHPDDVTLEVGTESFNVHATVVEGPERDNLLANIVEHAPQVNDYLQKTSRVIPIVALERV